MRSLTLASLVAVTALLLYGVGNIPERGSPEAPTNTALTGAGTQNAANYYIENAYADAETPNMVTVTLADYRSFDTLGETIVIFAAGLATALILRRRPE